MLLLLVHYAMKYTLKVGYHGQVLVLETLVLVHIILTTCTISVAVLNSNSSTLGNTVPFCLQAAGCVQFLF